MPEQEERQQLSRAAHDRLAAELEELTTDGRKQIAERLQRARELGDLSENAEYHETKNQQGMMEARIRKLEHILKNADVSEGPVTTDTAVVGTIITLRMSEGDDSRYLLAQSNEERAGEDDVYTLTISSPLGQAVQGKKVGEKIEWHAPKGPLTAELLKIEPWEG
jgi:transcription elongation factor GreA